MRSPFAAGVVLLLWASALEAQPAVPIFDTHIHYSAPDWGEYPEERILGILDRAGVTRALVSSTPDEGPLSLPRKAPARIVPILRPCRTREDMAGWWKDQSMVAYLESRLALAVHRRVGGVP